MVLVAGIIVLLGLPLVAHELRCIAGVLAEQDCDDDEPSTTAQPFGFVGGYYIMDDEDESSDQSGLIE